MCLIHKQKDKYIQHLQVLHLLNKPWVEQGMLRNTTANNSWEQNQFSALHVFDHEQRTIVAECNAQQNINSYGHIIVGTPKQSIIRCAAHNYSGTVGNYPVNIQLNAYAPFE